MERLTKRDSLGKVIVPFGDDNDIMEVYTCLAEMEDKIENGTLIEQPCKVGDPIWLVKYITCGNATSVEVFEEWIINKIVTTKYGTAYSGTHEGTDDCRVFCDDEYGVEWFTDKEKAAAKLKELKGK